MAFDANISLAANTNYPRTIDWDSPIVAFNVEARGRGEQANRIGVTLDSFRG
jgi:hypothetical protein